ncbi:MAG: hypothetical protein R2762_13870 [Bryobacteraceae bacterium]
MLRPLSLYLTPEGQKRFLIELAGDRISQEALQSIIAGELDRSRFLRSVSYALTRIEVTEDFSGGRVGTTVDMIGGLGPADCSVHFEQGVSYLFAAYKQGGFWTTSKCSGTDESLHAQSTIAALRELRDNRRPPGTIFGSIDPHTLAVRLVGPGGARELAPSHNGRYVFDKLESGDYQLEPSAPGWTFDIAPWTLPIHVNAGCMEVDIRATRR